MSVLAEIRPDEWNYVLLLHIGGAMILFGGTFTAASALAFARGDARILRLGYWSLLTVALPGYVLMRIGAERILTKEGIGEPDWIGVGYLVADLSALLLLIALIVGGIGVYRLRSGKGTVFLQATMAISLVLLVGYTAAIWAMSGKPG